MAGHTVIIARPGELASSRVLDISLRQYN